MPEIKSIEGGRSKGIRMEHLHKVKPGEERKALDAAAKDGADNAFVRTQAGDLWICSTVGLSRHLKADGEVEVNGERGRIVGFDNETNTVGEALKKRGPLAALFGGGAVLGGMAFFLRAASVNPIIMAGAAAGGALLGLVAMAFTKKKPNYDKIDEHGSIELAMAPAGKPASAAKTLTA